MLLASETAVDSGGEALCAGHADGAEGDMDGGEVRPVVLMVDAIEAGDGDVLGDLEAGLLDARDEIEGLVVCRADPGGDAIFGACDGLFDSVLNGGEGAGEDADEVLGMNFLLEAGHFFDEGAVAAEGPACVDGVVAGVEADALVAF